MWLIACAFPALCAVVLLLTGLLSPENALLAAVAGAVLKFGGGLANGLSTVMLADVVDYGNTELATLGEHHLFCTNHVGEIRGHCRAFLSALVLRLLAMYRIRCSRTPRYLV